jgi:hypothetical protein
MMETLITIIILIVIRIIYKVNNQKDHKIQFDLLEDRKIIKLRKNR